MLAHQQGRSSLAKQDRRRRRYLMEESFAQAANLLQTRAMAATLAARNTKLANRRRSKHQNPSRGRSFEARGRLRRGFFRLRCRYNPRLLPFSHRVLLELVTPIRIRFF